MAENTFGVLFSGLVEAIHVELSDEAVHLVMAEIPRKNILLELCDIFDDKFNSRWGPVNNFGKLVILNKNRYTLRI
jgi:hypothetical protein